MAEYKELHADDKKQTCAGGRGGRVGAAIMAMCGVAVGVGIYMIPVRNQPPPSFLRLLPSFISFFSSLY
jgi:hypothetical protein